MNERWRTVEFACELPDEIARLCCSDPNVINPEEVSAYARRAHLFGLLEERIIGPEVVLYNLGFNQHQICLLTGKPFEKPSFVSDSA